MQLNILTWANFHPQKKLQKTKASSHNLTTNDSRETCKNINQKENFKKNVLKRNKLRRQ